MKSANTLLATGMLLLAGSVQAATVSTFLDQSTKRSIIEQDIGYLKVTISDGKEGNIDFRVESLKPLKNLAGENYAQVGFNTFSFNFGDSGAAVENLALPDDWSIRNKEFRNNPFGVFDVNLRTRKQQLDNMLLFSIKGVEGDRPEDYLSAVSTGDARLGNYLFQAGLKGLTFSRPHGDCEQETLRPASVLADCNPVVTKGRARFAGGTSVVPIPAAAWLFGSALLGLFTTLRRKARAT